MRGHRTRSSGALDVQDLGRRGLGFSGQFGVQGLGFGVCGLGFGRTFVSQCQHPSDFCMLKAWGLGYVCGFGLSRVDVSGTGV